MIISFILGGLGNQCFQYALGRQLAHMQKVPLKLETLGYNFRKYAAHPYFLEKFRIKADRAGPLDYLSLVPRVFTGSLLTFERVNTFNSNVLKINGGTILVGYWQSYRYFSDIAHLIREELTLKDLPSPATLEMAERIRETEAVAIHARRSDYITNPKNAAMFQQCTPDYYRDAMSVIAQRVKSPHFFVFSDDPTWAKAHLHSEYPMTYVVHNDAKKGYEDLMLMRSCKHNITANSTFSWWGAWLNDNPNKIVVTPRSWFKDERLKEDDLLPQEWIRL